MFYSGLYKATNNHNLMTYGDIMGYHLVMTNSLPWEDPPFLIGTPGKQSINGPLSMAMLGITRG
jgi:hypothetical protein